MNIQPGKHEAVVESKGVRENTRLEGQPLEAFATFTVDNSTKLYWNGLLLTRDGNRNTKTMKCLGAMGCENEDVIGWLKSDAGQIVTLTVIEKTNSSGKIIAVVDWVNSGQQSEATPTSVIDKLKAAGLGREDDLPF